MRIAVRRWVLVALLAAVAFPAQATLIGRLALTPGGTDYQAAYDDVLDITWLTNANELGLGTWDQQITNIATLNASVHLGFNDWRLASISTTSPTTSRFNCNGSSPTDCANAGNELGYMFYHNLLGTFGTSETGNQTVDGVALTDIQSIYWSGTEYDSGSAERFLFNYGSQYFLSKDYNLSGWAVRSGDVVGVPEVGVPEPGTVLLVAIGLVGMGFARRSRR